MEGMQIPPECPRPDRQPREWAGRDILEGTGKRGSCRILLGWIEIGAQFVSCDLGADRALDAQHSPGGHPVGGHPLLHGLGLDAKTPRQGRLASGQGYCPPGGRC